MSSIAWPRNLLDFHRAKTPPPISADLSVSAKWIDRENELKHIRRYVDNWDGFGAPAPDPRIVDAAIWFLNQMRKLNNGEPPFRVTLSSNGSVSIEWQSKGYFLEAEIASERYVEWMEVLNGSEPVHRIESIWTESRSGIWDQTSQIAPGAAVSV